MFIDKNVSSWLEDQIVEVLIEGLQNKTMSEDKAEEIAKFVLQNIDSVKSETVTLLFLDNLIALDPVFKNLKIVIEGLFNRKEEHETAKKILALIEQGTPLKAIALANEHMQA